MPSALHRAKMHFPARYYFAIVLTVVCTHLLLGIWQPNYKSKISISSLTDKWHFGQQNISVIPDSGDLHRADLDLLLSPPEPSRVNATFVILVRNNELKDIVESIKQLEDRFNRQYHYPYVFLNDEPFSEEFKRWTQQIISGKAYYGVIPYEHWHQPDHIDEARAAAGRQRLIDDDVIYGESVPYRNMCRFNSGFFYRHPIMQKFRYYWRVEPGVKFFCDINYDPFRFMAENNKTYGFTVSLYEYESTIPSLWGVTKEFIRRNPQYLPKDNALSFVSDDDGHTYNLCHFWSNFEIADMELWRSEAYTKYFDWLDKKGGFYYERWGDAPVHTLGAALFSRKDQIHFFRDIGYRHEPFQHCPQGELHRTGKCWCEESDNFDYDGYSCTYRYDRLVYSIHS